MCYAKCQHFLYRCESLKSESKDLFNDVNGLLHVSLNFDNLPICLKWKVLLTGYGYNKYSEWEDIGIVVAKGVHKMLKKKKIQCRL